MAGPSHDPSLYRDRDVVPVRRALVSVVCGRRGGRPGSCLLCDKERWELQLLWRPDGRSKKLRPLDG